tara:strand:+ start:431 stop:646 length:216 start_codon:yes stop_codon:yes gene_type:complete
MGRVKSWMMDREDRAADRGSADRYYGRPYQPHIWLDGDHNQLVTERDMSKREIEMYLEAYENETDRKIYYK